MHKYQKTHTHTTVVCCNISTITLLQILILPVQALWMEPCPCDNQQTSSQCPVITSAQCQCQPLLSADKHAVLTSLRQFMAAYIRCRGRAGDTGRCWFVVLLGGGVTRDLLTYGVLTPNGFLSPADALEMSTVLC